MCVPMHQDIWISVLFHASHMPKVGQTACLAVVLHWYPFPSGVPSIYPHSVFCLFLLYSIIFLRTAISNVFSFRFWSSFIVQVSSYIEQLTGALTDIGLEELLLPCWYPLLSKCCLRCQQPGQFFCLHPYHRSHLHWPHLQGIEIPHMNILQLKLRHTVCLE